jgi:hypothetical protein
MSTIDVLLQVSYNNKGCHENNYTFSIGKISDEQCSGSGYTGFHYILGLFGSKPVTIMDPAPDADPSIYKHRN